MFTKSCRRAWFSNGRRREVPISGTDSIRRRNAGEGKVFLEMDHDVHEGKNLIDEAISNIDARNAAAEVNWDKRKRFVNE
jgi:hypothetical protein